MFDEMLEAMKDKKRLYILIGVAAAVLVAGIVLAVVLSGNRGDTDVTADPETSSTVASTDSTEQTGDTTVPAESTGATDETTPNPTEEGSGDKQDDEEPIPEEMVNQEIGNDEEPVNIGDTGNTGNSGNSGNGGNTGNTGDQKEEDKTPTIGVDTGEDETAPSSDESNTVIDFDDLIEASKKNEG